MSYGRDEIGTSVKTNFTINYNNAEIEEYLNSLREDGFELSDEYGDFTLTTQQFNKMVITYDGQTFILGTNSSLVDDFLGESDIHTYVPSSAKLLVKESEEGVVAQQIIFEEDQAITVVNGQEVYLSDITTSIKEGISINEARAKNGREKLDLGVSNINISEYTSGFAEMPDWAQGLTVLSVGGTAAYAVGSKAAERAVDKMVIENTASTMLGKIPGGKVVGLPKLGRTADGVYEAWGDIQQGNYADAALTIGKDHVTDWAFDRVIGDRIADATKLQWDKFISRKEFFDVFRGASEAKIAEVTKGSAYTSHGTIKEATKAIQDSKKTLVDIIEKSAQQSKINAIKAAEEAGVTGKQLKTIGNEAARATRNTMRQLVIEGVKNGDDFTKIIQVAEETGTKLASSIDEMVNIAANAARTAEVAGEGSNVGARIINTFRTIANSPVTKFVGTAAFVLTPIIEGFSGTMAVEEGQRMLDAAVTENDRNVAESRITTGRVQQGTGVVVGGTIAGVAGAAMVSSLAAGAGVGASIAAGGTAVVALASNPVGWAIGAALLINYAPKLWGGRTVTETIADAVHGVDREKEPEQKVQVVEPQVESRPIGKASDVEVKSEELSVSKDSPAEVLVDNGSGGAKPSKVKYDFADSQGTIQAILGAGKDLAIDNQIGANSFKKAMELGDKQAMALLSAMTGLEGDALTAEYAIAKEAANGGDQKYFRDIRSSDGYSDRMDASIQKLAVTMLNGSNYNDIVSNLNSSGASEYAKTISNISSIEEARNFGFLSGIEIAPMVSESLYVHSRDFVADLELESGKGLSPYKLS